MNFAEVRYTQLATGFRFTEGPVLHPDGALSFTDIFNDRVYRLHPDGRVETLETVLRRPNGMALADDGALLICRGGDRLLSRRDESGVHHTLAERYRGARLNSPNDVIGGPGGRIYFTDPAWAISPEEREQASAGVYLLDGGELYQVADNLSYPNGLALSPDGSLLYVSNSKPEDVRSLWVFDVKQDGSLGGGRLLAPMQADAEGVPDGMALHADGTIFCTGPGGVWVFRPGGELMGVMRPPENPANCTFSPGFETLYLTARTSVYAADLSFLGLPQ